MKSCDVLPAKFFKDNFVILGNIILDICNCSLRNGTFPDALMIAMVICLHKANSPLLCENYRPIFLLNVMGKVIEKLVYVRSQEYLCSNNILSDKEFGFSHSNESAFHSILTKIYSAFERDEYCLAVFLDVRKAFDFIDRNILIQKLEHDGVKGSVLSWFKSFFFWGTLFFRKLYMKNFNLKTKTIKSLMEEKIPSETKRGVG